MRKEKIYRKAVAIAIMTVILITGCRNNIEQEQSIPETIKADLFEGEYADYVVNEPSLEISKNDDDTYQIQILIYRLCFIDDGIGKAAERGLEFTITGPNGNEANGIIELEDTIATVTIWGQEWLLFAGANEYKFYKISDVPNLYY